MNLFEKALYFLQGKMECPIPFGWFHLLWIFLTLFCILILFFNRKKHNEKKLKLILFSYGIVALILEVLKQLIWSFNYDSITSSITWKYTWYSAPFQLCTTPIYVSIICLFLKKNKIRNSLFSYLAFYTILGSIVTIIMPESCFTKDILVNIHTMYLHCGSLVVSVYLLLSKEVKMNYKNLLKGFYIFLIFVLIANALNITFYNSGIIGTETFNMFYISPYFISELPVFNVIQENVPYTIYLISYIFLIFLGSNIVYAIASISKYTYKKVISEKH